MKRSATRTSAMIAVAVSGLAGTLVSTGGAAAVAAENGNNGRIKNVIYLLGDGMGVTQVAATRERYEGLNGQLAMETLPVKGFVSTYAVEKLSGQPGIGRSRRGSAVSCRKSPVAGPPLCSWPVECRKRGP